MSLTAPQRFRVRDTGQMVTCVCACAECSAEPAPAPGGHCGACAVGKARDRARRKRETAFRRDEDIPTSACVYCRGSDGRHLSDCARPRQGGTGSYIQFDTDQQAVTDND